MPLIAIAPCAKLPDYEESIRRAGGTPRVLDRAADTPADVVRAVRGILLTGGGDVDPALYGQPRHPTFASAEAGRDEYEIELTRRALEADLPVLAICRGLQLLNVARGGTLIQDIPDLIRTPIRHRLPDPRDSIAHDVAVVPGSVLASALRDRITADGTCAVNSRHHQAPQDLGNGLVVSAVASDGIIEALEDPGRRFCLGVQWHPENFWRTGEFKALFEAFTHACRISIIDDR
jgi:putative glutamine amidotransferase